MGSFHQQDMYEFVDDGVHKSIYTIFNQYHPFLKRDFSLANLINHVPDIQYINSGKIFIQDYKTMVVELSKMLLEITSAQNGEPEALVSGDDLNRIFDELKEASSQNSDCKFFSTIREYIEYAQKNMDVPETKELRDAIVRNATDFLSPKDTSKHRERLMTVFYLSQAENRIKALHPMKREPGQIPEWDTLQAIRKIITRKDGLKEYDEFYDEVSKEIRKAALVAIEKAKISTTCKMKRSIHVKEALKPTKACYSTEEEAKTEDLFDKLKRMPKKEENSWSFVSLEKPELLCDLQADYSQDGVENQRVVAFRYGRFKYTKTEEGAGGFNIDTTNMMPELVGISRIGKDGTKTYFVLMPPIDRIVYRSIKDKTVDPGDKLIEFSVTQDVAVKTPSGRTRFEKQTVPTNVVDGKTGKRLNIFRNKDIPEELEEFFAKVYFSDEYLSSVIKHNARYLGSVEQTKDGPVIHPTDEHKFDLAAAHYAEHFPGIVDRRMVKDFGTFCSSSELEIKQYNLINERETVLRETVQAKRAKRNEGQGLDD